MTHKWWNIIQKIYNVYIHKWFWRGHISSCGHPISSNNGEIHDARLGLFVPSFQTHPSWKIFRINVSRPNVVLSTLPATKICKSQAEQKHLELLCLAIMPSTTSRYFSFISAHQVSLICSLFSNHFRIFPNMFHHFLFVSHHFPNFFPSPPTGGPVHGLQFLLLRPKRSIRHRLPAVAFGHLT